MRAMGSLAHGIGSDAMHPYIVISKKTVTAKLVTSRIVDTISWSFSEIKQTYGTMEMPHRQEKNKKIKQDSTHDKIQSNRWGT